MLKTKKYLLKKTLPKNKPSGETLREHHPYSYVITACFLFILYAIYA